jgi:tetratricopeptide (TPR) repeat protein
MKKNKKIELTQVEQTVANKSNRFLFLIIGFLTFFVFSNTIGNDYNMDDELVTRNHPLTSQGLKAIGEIFTSPYYQDDMGYAYGYRPIVHLSFAIEHELFGEKASVSHFLNVILYVTCVLLFLSLLLKWVGEQNKWIAVVAVLFFAFHPIHTEVVASIKNRDEILAFLFMIASALLLEKYLEQTKKITLIWIFLCFTCAILTKKSVFPMAVLLPVIAVFIKKIEIKQLIIISITFIIPAVLIGANLNFTKMIAMSILILFAIGLAYIIRLILAKEINLKKILLDYRFISVLSLMILAFAFFENNLLYVYFSLIVLIPAYLINKQQAGIVFLIVQLISSWFFDDFDMSYFGLFVSLFIVFENFYENKKDWLFLIMTILFASLIYWIRREFIALVEVFAIVFFLYFLFKKWIVAILFSILTLAIVLILGKEIPVIVSMFLLLSILKLLNNYFKGFELIPFVLLGGLIILFNAQLGSNGFQFQHQQQQNQKIHDQDEQMNSVDEKKTIESTNFFREGRHLEYVENTLVAKHSTTETVGTGLTTLGEYAKLMVFPYELSFYYGFSKINTSGFNNILVWISLIFHLGLIVLAIWQLKYRPFLSIGIGWYLLSILLFSNWFELVAGMVGERLAFTASAGFSIFLASLIVWIKPNFNLKKSSLIEVAFLIVLGLFILKTIQRNSQWKDSITLMGNDMKHLQNSAQANNLYALKLLNSSTDLKTINLAIERFKIATTIYPEFFNAQFDLGRNYLVIGDTSNAIVHFKKVIELDNTFPDPYLNLVQIYNAKRDWHEYLTTAKKLYKVYNHSDAVIILAKGYLENFDSTNSRKTLEKGLNDFPENKDILFCLEDLKK